jgi:hypothetical protein
LDNQPYRKVDQRNQASAFTGTLNLNKRKDKRMQTTDFNETYTRNFNSLLNFCLIAKANGTLDRELFPESVLLLFDKYGHETIDYYLQRLREYSLTDFDTYVETWDRMGLPLSTIIDFLLDPTDFWRR